MLHVIAPDRHLARPLPRLDPDARPVRIDLAVPVLQHAPAGTAPEVLRAPHRVRHPGRVQDALPAHAAVEDRLLAGALDQQQRLAEPPRLRNDLRGPAFLYLGSHRRRLRRGSLQRGRGNLLARIHERQRGGRAHERAALGLDVDLRSGLRELDRHPHVADVLLELRRPDRVGDAPDLVAVLEDRPHLRELRAELSDALELDAHELAGNALLPDLLERRLADVVLRLLLHEPLEPADLERVRREVHVGVVVVDPGLDAASLHRGDGADVELLPRLEDGVPELLALVVADQVDLETLHRSLAGAADDDRDALDLEGRAPVVLQVVDPGADELLNRLRGLRALDLHRIDIRER